MRPWNCVYSSDMEILRLHYTLCNISQLLSTTTETITYQFCISLQLYFNDSFQNLYLLKAYFLKFKVKVEFNFALLLRFGPVIYRSLTIYCTKCWLRLLANTMICLLWKKRKIAEQQRKKKIINGNPLPHRYCRFSFFVDFADPHISYNSGFSRKFPFVIVVFLFVWQTNSFIRLHTHVRVFLLSFFWLCHIFAAQFITPHNFSSHFCARA